MMKWKSIKAGTLIKIKNQEGGIIRVGKNYYDEKEIFYNYILILSNVEFKDHKRSRKRKFYFKAAFYNDFTEKVHVDDFDRSMMRSGMKMIQDEKMAQKIQEACFFEGL